MPGWKAGSTAGPLPGVIGVPKSGILVPEMGRAVTVRAASGLASALFTPVQQTVLGLLFGQPERRSLF